jgi:hypothetical protein
MARISCTNCIHFRTAPYDAPRTGCWHKDNLVVKQKDAYLDEQQVPGDHRRINLRGDCAQFEARVPKLSLLKRLFSRGA